MAIKLSVTDFLRIVHLKLKIAYASNKKQKRNK